MSYVVKRSGNYQARWIQPDGKRRSKTFPRKIDAERFLTTVDADVIRNTYRDPSDARTLFGDYAGEWVATQVHRDSTQVATESHLRLHVLPTFGHRPLGSVRPTEVQRWVRSLLDEGLAPSTVKGIYRLVATIFRSAVTDRMIPSSPCAGIKLPKENRAPVEPLPVNAVRAIQIELPEDVRATVALGAGVGLRLGETLGLSVDRIDFLRRTVRIDRQLLLPKAGPPHFGPPKTAASNRTVPLPATVVEDLAAHIERHGEGPHRLLFHRKDQPIRRTRFWEWWKAAAKETEWPTAKFHDLRHHHASLLIAAGCSVKVVQSQLGHASAAETLDTYSHLWPEDHDRVRDAVDQAFAALISSPSDTLGARSPR